MPLPEKEYYSLQEMATRWQTSLEDIQYYAVHEQLEVMAWVDIGVINIYCLKKSEEGDYFPVMTGLGSYKDYAIVIPKELRQIFRSSPHPIRSFLNPKDRAPFEIHDDFGGYEVSVSDLVISRLERDRFEILYALLSPFADEHSLSIPVSSYPGRPSSMHQVQKHFMERCHQNVVLPSLQQEAAYLSNWAHQNIKDFHPPKAKSIMNAIRDYYKQHHVGIFPVAVLPEAHVL